MRNIWRRIGIPLALSATSVVLTLAVLEVVLRATTAPPKPSAARVSPPPGLQELRNMDDYTTPNVVGIMPGGIPYRANAGGFRGRARDRRKPPAVFRIALVGDSVTMGLGVAEEDTYAVRMERALNDPPNDVRYEVLNLGVAGYNARLIAHRLKELGAGYDPDLVFYGYTINDIEGPAYRRTGGQTKTKHMGDLSREEMARRGPYVTRFFRTHFYSLRELLWPPSDSYIYELDENYLRSPGALALLDEAFGRIQSFAADRGDCVVLMQHADLWFLHAFHPFRRHHAVVAQLATRHGFTNMDTVDYFVGHGGLDLWVSPFDPHPNGQGHAILARAALDALRAMPPTCWKGQGPPPSLRAH